MLSVTLNLLWYLTGFWIRLWCMLPLGTGRKLNVHKTSRRRLGCILNILRTLNLLSVPRWLKSNNRDSKTSLNADSSVFIGDFNFKLISSKIYLCFLWILDMYPALNFARHCHTTFGSNYKTYLRCPNIASWINSCQGRGKKILLSIGSGTRFNGFTSPAQAEQFANTLWNLFLGGVEVNPSLRTFGR